MNFFFFFIKSMWAMQAAGSADGAPALKHGFNKLSEVQTRTSCVCEDGSGRVSRPVNVGLHPDEAAAAAAAMATACQSRVRAKRQKPDIHRAAIFRGNAGFECLCDAGKIRARRNAVWHFYNAKNPRCVSFKISSVLTRKSNFKGRSSCLLGGFK